MSRELAFYDREDHPWRNPLLERTAIIGHTTTNTCKVWVRVRAAGKYMIVFSSDSYFPASTLIVSVAPSGTHMEMFSSPPTSARVS